MAGHPGRIDVGSVDHHPARLGEAIEDGEGFLALRGPAEHIAAEHQPRRFEAVLAELSNIHAGYLGRDRAAWKRPACARPDSGHGESRPIQSLCGKPVGCGPALSIPWRSRSLIRS